MLDQTVLIQKSGADTAGPRVDITLNRPDRRNVLSVAGWYALRVAFESLAGDPQLRLVVLRGGGSHFCAGADITEFQQTRSTRTQVTAYHEDVIAPCLQAIRQCPVPVIAAIQGNCIGGGLEVALCCDLRLAHADAVLGVPINKLGFPLAPRELEMLLGLVTPTVAAELLLEGRLLTAAEAARRGLITRSVSADDFEAEVEAAAARVLSGGPQAARATKALMRRLGEPPRPLSAAEIHEGYAFADWPDYQEGYQAFLAKRRPVFTGKGS
jgi:enoyl-CoA hydratase/carnithine racemase